VDTVCFDEKTLPGSLVRRPLGCALLDVAVGSGSVETTKYMLEFHRAKPTRETLQQSISMGNLELIKLLRERMPESEFRDRGDLLEVASEFHQPELLGWLLRDATVFELELLVVFAREEKLADALMVACENGVHPWWSPAHEALLKWQASEKIDFGRAPDGFSKDGGWWTDLSGVTSAFPGRRVGAELGPIPPDETCHAGPGFGIEWTAAKSRDLLDEKAL
jgi:hypothetical protein